MPELVVHLPETLWPGKVKEASAGKNYNGDRVTGRSLPDVM